MTDITSPPQTVETPILPNLEECTCMERTFFAIGIETGKQIRELIQAEIKNHMSSIETLKTIIDIMGVPNTNPADLCTPKVETPSADSCC